MIMEQIEEKIYEYINKDHDIRVNENILDDKLLVITFTDVFSNEVDRLSRKLMGIFGYSSYTPSQRKYVVFTSYKLVESFFTKNNLI